MKELIQSVIITLEPLQPYERFALLIAVILILAIITPIIWFFVHSALNADDSDSYIIDESEQDFWLDMAYLSYISDVAERQAREAEQEALKNDPDSVHYNIY